MQGLPVPQDLLAQPALQVQPELREQQELRALMVPQVQPAQQA